MVLPEEMREFDVHECPCGEVLFSAAAMQGHTSNCDEGWEHWYGQ